MHRHLDKIIAEAAKTGKSAHGKLTPAHRRRHAGLVSLRRGYTAFIDPTQVGEMAIESFMTAPGEF
jgi:hypothetical protein